MRPVMPFPRMETPAMALVRQSFSTDHIEEVRGETNRRLLAAGLKDKITKGARIAITAGSRGIGGFAELLNGIADAVREAGGEPFLIPAMGSHGGSTPEGQTEILRRLGVTEREVNLLIHATMETVSLGKAENGAVAHMDRNAFESDGVIVLGRVKTHPESAGELASGLLKMCTIGLGKQAGAQEAHTHGLWESVRGVPHLHLATGKIVFGVAVVENAFRQPVEIEVVRPTYDAFLEADIRLLKKAKPHLGTIPFDRLDLLVVDELGKTVSGSGMDLNVIGHWRAVNGPLIPDFRRIVVLSLTQGSLGNGLGIGLADFTTQRFKEAYDPGVTYLNLLTATEPGGTTREGPLPLALPSDREAIEVGLFSADPGPSPRVCRIKNTGELSEFWASEALLQEVKQNPKLTVIEPAAPFAFDSTGNLI